MWEFDVNRLSRARRVQVLRCLVEGNSIRSTVRITGVCKRTILRLLTDIGPHCAVLLDKKMRGLRCRRLQVDELWSFVGCTSKSKNKLDKQGHGNAWVAIAMDPETKLIPAWHLGERTTPALTRFMLDLSGRVVGRPQISTDGWEPYTEAVPEAFEHGADYGQVQKHYGSREGDKRWQYLYSEKKRISGAPRWRHISTSLVERANLTVRMCVRRFTRKTNGFSKKLYNHWCALALHFAYYNFARVHQTLQKTPAMAAGIAQRAWKLADLVGLLETWEARQLAAT